MEVSYSHRWLVPLSRKKTWDFFIECFKHSASVPEWPHSISTLRSKKGEIAKGNTIEATYKMGPIQSRAVYCIQEVAPEKKLAYETTSDHPLIGHSEIEFFEDPKGTYCHWHGKYRSKGWGSILMLGWFKTIFEPLFFSLLQSKTKTIHSDP